MKKPACKYCDHPTHYRGTRTGAHGVQYRRYKCTNEECKKWDKIPVTGSYPRQPKILLFDIECSPMEVYVWELRQRSGYIPPSSIIRDWFVISWAARWMYSGEELHDVVTPEEAINSDDSRILTPMWELLNEADVVITHNGNRYDLKKLNTRFLIHGFPPPHSYQSIDTFAVAKKTFDFSSNGIDFINKTLGLPPKKENGGMNLWKRCVNGDAKALQEMADYNIQDVYMMEETYLRLRPWIGNHPNLALLAEMDGTSCPICMSKELRVESVYSTHVSQYQEYRCQVCGAIGRGRYNIAPKNKNLKRPNVNPYPRSIPKVV